MNKELVMKSFIRISMCIVGALAVACMWVAHNGCAGGNGPTVESNSATGKVFTTDYVSVTFSRAMEQASVESAFSVTGSDPVAGTFSWADNTVTFTPDELWKTRHQYTITVGTGAKDAKGNGLKEEFTQDFRAQLNLHDVNGDRINDFMLGAPFHDYDAGTLNSGQAHLFLGKSEWSDIELSSQPADATYTHDGAMARFGFGAMVVGDVNGDGYADLAMGAPGATITNANDGFVGIVFGSADPTGSFKISDAMDTGFVGTAANDNLGTAVMPAGDVNGDGLADIIVGSTVDATSDSRFWLVLGRKTGFPDPATKSSIDSIADANYIVEGKINYTGYPVTACDFNGDELDDLIMGSPAAVGGVKRGKVFLVSGTATPSSIDLRVASAQATFTGAADGSELGAGLTCGDVNGDGFDDLFMGAPKISATVGRTYLVTGSATLRDYDFGSESPTALITGGGADTFLGINQCVPGDINDDGFNDYIIGAPYKAIDGHDAQGEAYLFLGAGSPANVDLGAGGTADATYTGQVPPTGTVTALGFCKAVGDVNGDGIDDILLGAPGAEVGGKEWGKAYIEFGSTAAPESIDFETQNADITITSAASGDFLQPVPVED